MSKKQISGLSVLEKMVGIVIMIIGAILTYQTYENMKAAGLSAGLFIAFGVAIFVVGAVLTIAKTR